MGHRARRTAALTAAACAAAWLGCAGAVVRDRPAQPPSALDLAGRSQTLALAPGERALVLHFWATWCPACVEELVALERAAPACRARGVRVVALNVGESAEEVTRYAASHGLALEVLLDARGEIWRASGARSLPANWLWTAAGASTSSGAATQAEWSARLRELGC